MRDRAAERALVDALLEVEEVAGFDALWQVVARMRRLVPERRLHGFATVALAELLPLLEELPGPRAHRRRRAGRLQRGGRRAAHPGVDVGCRRRRPDRLVRPGHHGDGRGRGRARSRRSSRPLARGHEQLILDSGTWFRLDRPELEALRALVEEARSLQDQPSDPLRISVLHAGLWDELAALGVVEQQSARWSQAVEALLDLDAVSPPPCPTASRRPCGPTSSTASAGSRCCGTPGSAASWPTTWAWARRCRSSPWCCAPTSAASSPTRCSSSRPTSVLSTWQSEAARFAPELRTVVVDRTRAKAGRGPGDDDRGRRARHHLVCRRPHRRRGLPVPAVGGGRARRGAVRQEPPGQDLPGGAAAHRPGPPSRSPARRSRTRSWTSGRCSRSSRPGCTRDRRSSRSSWAKPIEVGRDPELLATLRRRIRPLMLRRTKEAVATDLPPKQEQVLPVDLHPRHRAIYDRHLQRERQRLLGLIDDLDGNRIAILRALTVLRQMSLDPALVDPAYAGLAPSAKVDALVEQLGELAAEGHRALVFSQFTGFLALVRGARRRRARPRVPRRVDPQPRRADRRRFREGDAPVFLISLKAGGFGLTLTEADYVFVLDPWWNPAAEAQAIDRAHRIGQTRPVNVYRLVSRDTIEEKVVALQERKRDLFARVVDDGAVLSSAITADDLRELLGP